MFSVQTIETIYKLWCMLDLARLEALVAFARTGSVSAAADELHYSQPTISHHLKRLEAETGAVLWKQRTNSGVIGVPSSYAIDGVQYIAIAAGGGPNNLALTPEIRQRSGGNTLFVFRLR